VVKVSLYPLQGWTVGHASKFLHATRPNQHSKITQLNSRMGLYDQVQLWSNPV